LLLAGLFGAVFSLGFLAVVGAPSWWLTRLAMTWRPVPGGEKTASIEQSAEWFPPGMLVLWAALLGAALVLLAIPMFGFDAQTFHARVVDTLTQMLRLETATPADKPVSIPGVQNVPHMLDVLAVVLPPAAAVLATLINLIDLWLAGRIVRLSSRLARPWPQLSAMSFPAWVSILLAVAIGLTFAGGIAAIAAGVVTATLMVVYAVLGFAVLHEITRGRDSRAFVLAGAYASVLVFGWPMLLMFLLGLAETAFGIRARVAAKRTGSAKR